jgi:hypothetical protein
MKQVRLKYLLSISKKLPQITYITRIPQCPTPPEPKGEGTHSPAGEVVGGSQFGRLEKKLSTLSTLWKVPVVCKTMAATCWMRGVGSVMRWVRKGVEVVLSSASPFFFVFFSYHWKRWRVFKQHMCSVKALYNCRLQLLPSWLASSFSVFFKTCETLTFFRPRVSHFICWGIYLEQFCEALNLQSNRKN